MSVRSAVYAFAFFLVLQAPFAALAETSWVALYTQASRLFEQSKYAESAEAYKLVVDALDRQGATAQLRASMWNNLAMAQRAAGQTMEALA